MHPSPPPSFIRLHPEDAARAALGCSLAPETRHEERVPPLTSGGGTRRPPADVALQVALLASIAILAALCGVGLGYAMAITERALL